MRKLGCLDSAKILNLLIWFSKPHLSNWGTISPLQTLSLVPEEPEVDTEIDEANNNSNISGEALISFSTEGMTVEDIMEGLDMLEEINTTRSDTVQKMITTLREMLDEEEQTESQSKV